MKIPSALQPLLDKTPNQTEALLRLFKPGQMLRATIDAIRSNGLAQLRIGNTPVEARTPTGLEPGQQLLLKVEQGLPQPLLRIVRAAVQGPPTQQLRQHAMARQLPPQEVARQVQAIKRQLEQLPPDTIKRLPVFKQALKVLDPPASEPGRLSPGILRRTVRDSGLLMEHLLLRDGVPPTTDRKLLLLQLLRLLQPHNRTASEGAPAPGNTQGKDAPPPQTDQLLNRLMRLVEGSIARIQSHQAQTLASSDDPNRLVWQIDLPLQVGNQRDHLELKIQQENEAGDAGATSPTWKVEVRFEFEELGPVFSRITLQGKKLHCAFWSDLASTAKRFEKALPRLEQTLQQAGLEVSAISSLHGAPPADAPPAKRLLDERA